MKKLVCLSLAVIVFAPVASACWDNTDQIVEKLKRLTLSTEQLKDIFAYHKEHKAVVARAHFENLGCRYHENHDAVFEKQAVGVLTDKQFKRHTGRTRTKVESLEYENRQLKKEIARLQEQIKQIKAALEAIKKEKAKK